MNSYFVKSYIVIDKSFSNIELLEKYIFLITQKKSKITKITNGILKLYELPIESFVKLKVSTKTIKNDLMLNKLLLIEVPFYKDSLVSVLKEADTDTLYEIILEKYKNNLLDLNIVKDILNKIDDYLLETVKTYIDLDCSLKLTSDMLFTHRNTINYRITRFCHLTDINLKNGKNIPLTRLLIYIFRKEIRSKKYDV